VEATERRRGVERKAARAMGEARRSISAVSTSVKRAVRARKEGRKERRRDHEFEDPTSTSRSVFVPPVQLQRHQYTSRRPLPPLPPLPE
jgi:hypothetical protein